MLSWQNNINISRSYCLSYANFLSVVDVYCFERKEENWKGLVRLLLCRIPDARFYHETFVLETVTFMAGTRHFPWLFPLLLIMFLLPQKNKTIGNINRALLYIQPVKLIELEQYFVNSCKYQTFCKYSPKVVCKYVNSLMILFLYTLKMRQICNVMLIRLSRVFYLQLKTRQFYVAAWIASILLFKKKCSRGLIFVIKEASLRKTRSCFGVVN